MMPSKRSQLFPLDDDLALLTDPSLYTSYSATDVGQPLVKSAVVFA